MPTFTPEEYAKLDDQGKLIVDAVEALRRGDRDTSWELTRQLDIPAHALMAAKKANGAEWIRQKGLKTATAEAKYGKDWLDK